MSKIIKEIPIEELFRLFDRDVKTSDIRLLSITGGYYLDYMISRKLNSLMKVKNDYIINLDFLDKVNMLKAIGYFDVPELKDPNEKELIYFRSDLLSDITKLNTIRNIYAHRIFETAETINNDIHQHIKGLFCYPYISDEERKDYKRALQIGFAGAFSFLVQDSDIFDPIAFEAFL